MREREVKILGIDPKTWEEKILEKGGRFLGEEFQTNYRINSGKHPLSEELGYLRIRKTTWSDGREDPVELTLKENLHEKGIRSSKEHTVHVDDPQTLLHIFALLGYDQVEVGKKHRKSFSLLKGRIDIDRWDKAIYPYPYGEIEVEAPEDLQEIIDILDIPERSVSLASIADLRREYEKKKSR